MTLWSLCTNKVWDQEEEKDGDGKLRTAKTKIGDSLKKSVEFVQKHNLAVSSKLLSTAVELMNKVGVKVDADAGTSANNAEPEDEDAKMPQLPPSQSPCKPARRDGDNNAASDK